MIAPIITQHASSAQESALAAVKPLSSGRRLKLVQSTKVSNNKLNNVINAPVEGNGWNLSTLAQPVSFDNLLRGRVDLGEYPVFWGLNEFSEYAGTDLWNGYTGNLREF